MQTIIRTFRLTTSRNKTKLVAFSLVLSLIFSTAIAMAAAQSKVYTAMPDRETSTNVSVAPSLIGLGQKVLIDILVYPAPSGPTFYAQDYAARLQGWENISVSFTKPDGSKDTFMPIDMTLANVGKNVPGASEVIGSLCFYYTPDQIGNWSVTATFPGNTLTTDKQYANMNLSVYYKPSSNTIPTKFAVQQEQVLAGQLNGYPWSPLPKNYWTSPVSVNNREWATISGDWTQTSYDYLRTGYNPYSTAPNSAHILWKNQISLGGLPGGDWGSLAYAGAASSGPGAPPPGSATVVMDGKIYQDDASGGTYSCIDLETGQLLWRQSGSIWSAQRLSPFYQTASQQNEGAISAWLWDTRTSGQWKRYDPFTGILLQNITNAPSTGAKAFSDGSPIVYVTQYGGFNTTIPMKQAYEYLIKWNYTKVTNNNWLTGIVWNVSIRQPDGVGVGDGRPIVWCYPYPEANVVICKSVNAETIMMGFDMTTGKYLWRTTTPIDLASSYDPSGGPNGPMFIWDGSSASMYAYDPRTGNEMWHTQVGSGPWEAAPCYTWVAHNDTFYLGSFDGHVYALNMNNGNIKWKSDYVGDTTETVYGTHPFQGGSLGADGKVYFSTANIYSLQPRSRFQKLFCIDENTGHFLWNLTIGPVKPCAIADGYLLATDTDNGIQYCIGKGQTKTTVETPLTGIATGNSIMIEGTVLDLSPSAPNTPAISDEDMSQWMDYLHGQNATLINNPPKPNGITIRLAALAPNGNVIDIGTVTSDSSGMFKKLWTPDTEGEYTIYATFDGSNSYWGSYAEAALGVTKAPPDTSGTQQQVVVPDYTMLILGGIIAVIIAVAIVGALLFITLRKR